MNNLPPPTYFDNLQWTFGPHGVRFMFSIDQANEQPMVVAHLAASPTLAKVVAIVMRRAVKAYEDRHGEITIPPDAAKAAGISPREDWS